MGRLSTTECIYVPTYFNRTHNTNTMHACVMTVKYLSSGLSACSVVRISVSFFFLQFKIFLMQPCKISVRSFKNHGSYLLFLGPFKRLCLF